MAFFGIDLGTTHVALAKCIEPGSRPEELNISQLSQPQSILQSTQLPACIYLPTTAEKRATTATLPWQRDQYGQQGDDEQRGHVTTDHIIGQYALDRGSEVDGRLIQSAKSWLCFDPNRQEAAQLPWQSPVEHKLTPLQASTAYLEHVTQQLKYAEQLDLSSQVIITVPASFDEVARTQTLQAAQLAGLKKVSLLEEPQAALYAWIASQPERWRNELESGDVVLICDIGGGTTDFSLVLVQEAPDGQLQLERLAVGDHLLLGGDNMDLSLAVAVKADMEKQGQTSLTHQQFQRLIPLVRKAKERLLAGDQDSTQLDSVDITLPSEGASLFAQPLSAKLSRDSVEQCLVEGFFPLVGLDVELAPEPTGGLRQLGLPYAHDPAISKHLASFLRRAAKNLSEGEAFAHADLASAAVFSTAEGTRALLPTKVLLNGGVFKSPRLQERLSELLATWTQPGEDESTSSVTCSVLGRQDLDFAVAKGAAYYNAILQTGSGLRIRSSAARSYYLGLETQAMAIPGYVPPIQGVCVVPQGMEEGSRKTFETQTFGLVVGRKARFRFFSATDRASDRFGSIVANAPRTLQPTADLEVEMKASDSSKEGELVNVRLHSHLDELGMLHLSMRSVEKDEAWDLQLDVRKHEQ